MSHTVHWLEPLLPSPISDALLAKAADVIECARQFKASVADYHIDQRIRSFRIANSLYSNLLEGVEVSYASLSPDVKWGKSEPPLNVGEAHIRTQAHFEQLEMFSPDGSCDWSDTFSIEVVTSLHRHLFEPLDPQDMQLGMGQILVPGQLRSASERNVLVGRHSAPDWQIVEAMLKRMQQAYGMQRDPRCQLIACLAFHHRLAYVHPFDDGNGRVGRLLLHLQLQRLGLEPKLWSICQTIYEQRQEYFAALANADQNRRGDLDGRGQLTQAGLVDVIGLLLQAIRRSAKFL